MVIIRRRPRDLLNTRTAKWNLINLSPFRSTRLSRTAASHKRSILEQLLHARPLNNSFITTEQAAIAAPMPEAPSQAHALVAAEDDLAAHLADREVEEGVVARLASQAGTAAQHPRRVG
ncbi:hypothetical protein DHEL01_v204089 [Diaporthe helianthi]|uniref:Uncharacterized protein n=1 Tax=Diaporthe helianthi TaxID=158607 RepID=A0A2P5I4U7_DIAHE|nr:hypothetical protein DHEL01_v204089 [Diaporthe helianthi]